MSVVSAVFRVWSGWRSVYVSVGVVYGVGGVCVLVSRYFCLWSVSIISQSTLVWGRCL